jgi:hypothetical protein
VIVRKDLENYRLAQAQLTLQEAFSSMKRTGAVGRDTYLLFQKASDDIRSLLVDLGDTNRPVADELKAISEKLEQALLIDLTDAHMVDGRLLEPDELVEGSTYSLVNAFPKPDAFADPVHHFRAFASRIFESDSPQTSDASEALGDLLKELNGYVGSDVKEKGNYERLPISDEDLQLVRASLRYSIEAQSLPEWSHKVIKQIKGCLAILEALSPVILPLVQKLARFWNKAISALKVNLGEIEDANATAGPTEDINPDSPKRGKN